MHLSPGESEDLVAPHRDLVFEEYMTINQVGHVLEL